MPTTTQEENEEFYQEKYSQDFTSEVPTLDVLEQLKRDNFRRSPKDFTEIIEILKTLDLPESPALLDFGCSWGYGSFQLLNAGFEVTAFEISEKRRNYARENLGVQIIESLDDIPDQSVDMFFSSHVLEHVPSPIETIDLAKRVLRKGGYFVAFTPNGSADFRSSNEPAWRNLWGKVHPNLLDERFYRKHLAPNAIFSSSPHDLSRIKDADTGSDQSSDTPLIGSELLVISRF